MNKQRVLLIGMLASAAGAAALAALVARNVRQNRPVPCARPRSVLGPAGGAALGDIVVLTYYATDGATPVSLVLAPSADGSSVSFVPFDGNFSAAKVVWTLAADGSMRNKQGPYLALRGQQLVGATQPQSGWTVQSQTAGSYTFVTLGNTAVPGACLSGTPSAAGIGSLALVAGCSFFPLAVFPTACSFEGPLPPSTAPVPSGDYLVQHVYPGGPTVTMSPFLMQGDPGLLPDGTSAVGFLPPSAMQGASAAVWHYDALAKTLSWRATGQALGIATTSPQNGSVYSYLTIQGATAATSGWEFTLFVLPQGFGIRVLRNRSAATSVDACASPHGQLQYPAPIGTIFGPLQPDDCSHYDLLLTAVTSH